MKRVLSLVTCATVLMAFAAFSTAADRSETSERPHVATWHSGLINTGGNGASSFSKLGTDTLSIYGGPGSLLGKFQDINGIIPDQQGWLEVDSTDQPALWQASTFNSPNGSTSMWAGQTAAQQPGYTSAPGYGNNWNALLTYTKTVSNPAAGQTVGLSFLFNYEVETAFDFFNVEYDSFGATIPVLSLTGSNRDTNGVFQPVSFPTGAETHAISYGPNSYSGVGSDEIVIRLTVTSDGGWSDEDGQNPTDGAAQVDNIVVTSADGVDSENFEGVGPFQWVPEKPPFAGFFGKVFARVTDVDPCREAVTPVLGFIDDGTPPSNPSYVGAGTGGTSSVNWAYGVPGGWVVNYNGGISANTLSPRNEFWSPAIEVDLPGPADDDLEFAGLRYNVSVYEHLPLLDGMFWQWHVRGSLDGGTTWGPWGGRGFVYFSGTPRWVNNFGTVADLLPQGPTHVQFRLLWRDSAALFAFAGIDATPSPLMDNFSMQKYRIAGPTFANRNIDMFNDGFASSGGTDVSTQAARDDLDIRVDMARDVSTGALNVPGDSIIVDIASVLPGVAITDSLTQITMHYSLNMNPLFEDAIRGNAPVTSVGTGMKGWDQSEGTIQAGQSTNSLGVPNADRYFFDFPDVDFLYPGDVLEWYVEAVDDDGRATTFPANIAGYDDLTSDYNRLFTVRGLPTYTNLAGDTPDILFINDNGRRGAGAIPQARGGEDVYLQAFNQNGLFEGVHFDTYTITGPSSNVSNGIGSAGAHGANAAQLQGYSCIIYENANLNGNALSDGTNTGNNDKGDDIGVLTAWHGQDADRYIAYFGDAVYSSLVASGASAQTYLSTVMGVGLIDGDVRDEIGGQTAPVIIPTGNAAGFTEPVVAYGGCLAINQFDSIVPLAGAVASHGFEVAGAPGTTYAGPAAAVLWDRIDGLANRKVDMSFPVGLRYIQNNTSSSSTVSDRSVLLQEILDYFGASHLPAPGTATATDGATKPQLAVAGNFPNPFNPTSTIKYSIGVRGPVVVNVYNTRGELVKQLHSGVQEAGPQAVTWNGVDDNGAAVSSGVYLYRIIANGFTQTNKMVMVK